MSMMHCNNCDHTFDTDYDTECPKCGWGGECCDRHPYKRGLCYDHYQGDDEDDNYGDRSVEEHERLLDEIERHTLPAEGPNT